MKKKSTDKNFFSYMSNFYHVINTFTSKIYISPMQSADSQLYS